MKDSVVLAQSDTLILRTAGGGGYGDPNKRNPQLVAQDLENGYITERDWAAAMTPES